MLYPSFFMNSTDLRSIDYSSRETNNEWSNTTAEHYPGS